MAALTTLEAAARLGITDAHVRRLAAREGIGRKHGARAWVFSEADLRKLQKARRPVGRPAGK